MVAAQGISSSHFIISSVEGERERKKKNLEDLRIKPKVLGIGRAIDKLIQLLENLTDSTSVIVTGEPCFVSSNSGQRQLRF